MTGPPFVLMAAFTGGIASGFGIFKGNGDFALGEGTAGGTVILSAGIGDIDRSTAAGTAVCDRRGSARRAGLGGGTGFGLDFGLRFGGALLFALGIAVSIAAVVVGLGLRPCFGISLVIGLLVCVGSGFLRFDLGGGIALGIAVIVSTGRGGGQFRLGGGVTFIVSLVIASVQPGFVATVVLVGGVVINTAGAAGENEKEAEE